MIEIIHGIYISDITDSHNISLHNLYNINIVINCTTTHAFINKNNIQKIRIPLSYEMNENDKLSLKKFNHKIMNLINDNFIKSNILICCYDGKSISPLIVSLYLSQYGGLNSYEIIEYLKTKNKDICIDYDINYFIK